MTAFWVCKFRRSRQSKLAKLAQLAEFRRLLRRILVFVDNRLRRINNERKPCVIMVTSVVLHIAPIVALNQHAERPVTVEFSFRATRFRTVGITVARKLV